MMPSTGKKLSLQHSSANAAVPVSEESKAVVVLQEATIADKSSEQAVAVDK
jgi:hypothetical protein